jgi:AsmA-like protein
MRRILKWLVILFVLVPLGLFLVVWAALEVIPQAKWRSLAAEELGKKLNRQVEIGPIHLAFSGLAVDALRVSEIPNFQAGAVIEAKGISLGWGLRSLWQGLDIKKKYLTRSSGHFRITEFRNPHYLAHDFSIRWSLSDMDPTWSHLNGRAQLDQGRGLLLNIDQLMATSPSAKIALMPVLALMNLEKLGFLKIGLPDLRRWPIQGIRGTYTFTNGRMTIERFTIDSPQLGMETAGVVELGSGNLLLDVQLHSPKTSIIGSLEAKLRVSGTVSNPKVDLTNLKKQAFRATIKNLLENPQNVEKNIGDTIQKLFH